MSVCVVIVNIVKDEENFVVIIDYGVVFMLVKLVIMVRFKIILLCYLLRVLNLIVYEKENDF